MKHLDLFRLFCLIFLFDCGPKSFYGVVILENQSDYYIDIYFPADSNSLTKAMSLAKNGGIWKKSYNTDDFLVIPRVFGDVNLAFIVYDQEKVKAHSLDHRDINYEELYTTQRHFLIQDSYKVENEGQTSLGIQTGEADHRYIFTNADYEAADLIDP